MFVFRLAAIGLALVVFGQPVWMAAVLALGTAVVATAVEVVSPFGLDNLTGPLVSGGALVAQVGLVA